VVLAVISIRPFDPSSPASRKDGFIHTSQNQMSQLRKTVRAGAGGHDHYSQKCSKKTKFHDGSKRINIEGSKTMGAKTPPLTPVIAPPPPKLQTSGNRPLTFVQRSNSVGRGDPRSSSWDRSISLVKTGSRPAVHPDKQKPSLNVPRIHPVETHPGRV